MVNTFLFIFFHLQWNANYRCPLFGESSIRVWLLIGDSGNNNLSVNQKCPLFKSFECQVFQKLCTWINVRGSQRFRVKVFSKPDKKISIFILTSLFNLSLGDIFLVKSSSKEDRLSLTFFPSPWNLYFHRWYEVKNFALIGFQSTKLTENNVVFYKSLSFAKCFLCYKILFSLRWCN